MNCRECQALMPALADQELAPRDAEAVQAHLAACPSCARAAARQAAFVEGLRERLSRDPMPAPARARVLARLRAASSPAPRTRAPRFAWSSLAGLAMAAAVALAWLVPRAPVADWAQYYRDQHQSRSAAVPQLDERSSSPQALAARLAARLGHPLHVPQMGQARLLGGSVCILRGQPLGMALYRSQGRLVSLFMGEPSLLCPGGLKVAPGELYAHAGRPYAVVAWEHQGHFHVVVSDLELGQLQALARQCQASVI